MSGALLDALGARFEQNMHRHEGVSWADVMPRVKADSTIADALSEMERTGGEPDIVVFDGERAFVDCSAESPAGRRSLCYDGAALESRKKHKPDGSAVEMAVNIGIELLSEEQYRALQGLEEFDLKTSSWVLSPPDVRELGGAIFCDRRYGRVFTYHNGAESYYASRGFRGLVSF